MVEPDRVRSKLGSLDVYLKGLDEKRGVSLEEFRGDRDLQDIVERRFEKAIQASIDIASHLVASLPLKEPNSYRDLFLALAQEDILDEELAEAMAEMAGFRNVLAHDYADIDTAQVHAHLDHLERFRRFAEAVHAYLKD